MILVAASLPVGRAVDTSAKLSPYVCRVLRASGYLAVGRYVPLPGNSASGDIDGYELGVITGAGLACWLVQHVRSGHWDPAQHDGRIDGDTAAMFAVAAGHPQGAHLFLDLEAMSGASSDAIVFANAWAETVKSHGYRAGCYHGFDCTLTPDQLYHALSFDSYWRAPGQHLVSERGDAIGQGPGITIAGIEFDLDTIMVDEKGDVPYGAIAAPADVA